MIDKTCVGSYQVVVPEVTGSAYITEIHQIVINSDDPLKYGFLF